MRTNIGWAMLAIACALAGCKREVPVAVPTRPASTPPPPAASAPEPAKPQPSAEPPKTAAAPEAAKPSAPASPVEAAAVTSATLGSAVNADKRVTAASDAFRPGDTIFLAVETSGAGGADLTARWSYLAGGQETRVNEETQKVPPGGPSVTEFHVRKPDGWPPGEYQVVLLVNGEASVTKKFRVLK